MATTGDFTAKNLMVASSCSLESLVRDFAVPRPVSWFTSTAIKDLTRDVALGLQVDGIRVGIEVSLPGRGHRPMRIPLAAIRDGVLGIFKVVTIPAKLDKALSECRDMVEAASQLSADLELSAVRGFVVLAGGVVINDNTHVDGGVLLVPMKDVSHGLLG